MQYAMKTHYRSSIYMYGNFLPVCDFPFPLKTIYGVGCTRSRVRACISPIKCPHWWLKQMFYSKAVLVARDFSSDVFVNIVLPDVWNLMCTQNMPEWLQKPQGWGIAVKACIHWTSQRGRHSFQTFFKGPILSFFI